MSEKEIGLKASPFLWELLNAIGPSGHEQEPVEVWRSFVQEFADVSSDVHGNSFAAINAGGTPRVMIAGHIDEIGLQICHIDKKGFLFFQTIGGWDPQVLVGQHVWVGTGRVPGVIGKKPLHLQESEERKKVTDVKKMFIDIGASSHDRAKKQVALGDFAVIARQPELLGEFIASRACDDRVGAYVVARVVELLAEEDTLSAEVVAVATVQEEVGLRGATTSAFRLNPHVGFAVDVTFATDDPSTKELVRHEGEVALGGGPVISRGPNSNPRLVDMVIAAASDNGIPYQIASDAGLPGTDARVMQVSGVGVATSLISIPNRYMHSPSEMIHPADLEYTAQLIAKTCLLFDSDTDFRL